MMPADGIWFKEEAGRTLLLRSANLGDSTGVRWLPGGPVARNGRLHSNPSVTRICNSLLSTSSPG